MNILFKMYLNTITLLILSPNLQPFKTYTFVDELELVLLFDCSLFESLLCSSVLLELSFDKFV